MNSLAKLFLALLLTWSSSVFALESLNCDAQVAGMIDQTGYTAPALVSSSADALNEANYRGRTLELDFNVETLRQNERTYLILDGRHRRIDVNAHLTVRSLGDGVEFQLRDTISGQTMTNELYPEQRMTTFTLYTGKGSFRMKCRID